MKLVEALAFLLPHPVTTAEVAVIERDARTQPVPSAPAVINYGRTSIPSLPLTHPHCHRFVALPRTRTCPRALAPDDNLVTVRRLLMPRARAATPARGLAVALINAAPTSVYRYAGRSFTFATRHESAVLAALRGLVPDPSIGVLVGNPKHPERVAVFAFRGAEVAAVAKVVTAETARRRLLDEAAMLRDLAGMGRLVGTVPQCLSLPDFHLGAALVTDSFAGEPAALDLAAGVDHWLERCVSGDTISVLDARPVGTMKLGGSYEPGLGQAVGVASEALRDIRVRRTVVHGDFAPWNIIMKGTEPQVFDWEYGTLHGVPEWDALHFVAQVGVIVRGWDSAALTGNIEQHLARGSAHYSADGFRAVAALVLADLGCRASAADDHDRARVLSQAAGQVASQLTRVGAS